MSDEHDQPKRRESEALRLLRSRRTASQSADAPTDSGSQPAPSSRYDVTDEIGRGGVGIVYRGKDVELGRDVAMKVLNEHHLHNPDVVDRFVEEAQIGGQLQHPGIVPVYEIGLQHDDRPYFAMKLIQGETLAEQLARRADVQDDRQRLIGIFEQVCQTMAYAHARRVVHRDLKPENVMIGAFGEVQVVDWGFAKVLGDAPPAGTQPSTESLAADPTAEAAAIATVRSDGQGGESIVGAVLGTPAYMPKEQALGDVERMDLRSDVFGLGGILCEILTGQPPYVGPAGEALLAAARAKLEDAHSRLAQCGADASLVELCRHCLQSEPDDRPADAKQVADVVHEYLVSLEDRARQAQIKAAEARVRARATILLSAAAVLFLVVGGGGYFYLEQEASARTERATARVQDASAEARSALAAARTAGPADVVRWQAAVAAATQVEALAADEDVAAGTRERMAELVATITSADTTASTARQQAERDRQMLDAMIAIVVDSTAGSLAPSARDQQQRLVQEYDDLLATYLDDERIEDLDDATVAARLTAGAIEVEIAVALDHWAVAREKLDDERRSNTESGAASHTGPTAHRLRELARRIDPDDEWRNAARAIMAQESLEVAELERLADDIDWDTLPATSIQLLASSLWESGARSRAIDVLRRGHDRHPQNFGLAFRLGSRLAETTTLDPKDALACFRTARAIRALPQCDERIAWLKDECGDSAGALADLERMLADDPEFLSAWNALGVVHLNADRFEDALAAFERAVSIGQDRVGVLTNIGTCWMHQEEYEKAAAAYRRVLEIDPEYVNCLGNYAGTLHNMGQWDEALEFARRAIALDANNWAPHNTIGNVLGDQREFAGAEAAFRRAIELAPRTAMIRHNLGQLYIRSARAETAIPHFRKAIELDPTEPRHQAGLAQAMLHSNDVREARTIALAAQDEFGEDPYLLDIIAHTQERAMQHAAAIETWKRVVELRPGNADAYAEIGRCYGETRRPKAAVEWLEKAAERTSKHPRVAIHSNLSACYAQIGNPDKSLEHARLAVKADPNHAPSRFNLGNSLAARGEVQDALEHLEQACLLWRDDDTPYGRMWYPRACAQYANFCKSARQPTRAEPVLAECAERHPKHALVLLELGDVLQAKEQFAEAVPLYERSLAADDSNGFAWFNLMRSAGLSGQPAKALAAARRAVPCFERDGTANAQFWLGHAKRAIPELEQLVESQERLLAIATGQEQAASAKEQMQAASTAVQVTRFEAAVTAFERGFEQWPELLDAYPHAYNAACAAARAGAAAELAPAAAEALRDKAHAWLTIEFARLQGELPPGGERDNARKLLEHWQNDGDLTSVRENAALARLPSAERERWQALWTSIATLHEQLGK